MILIINTFFVYAPPEPQREDAKQHTAGLLPPSWAMPLQTRLVVVKKTASHHRGRQQDRHGAFRLGRHVRRRARALEGLRGRDVVAIRRAGVRRWRVGALQLRARRTLQYRHTRHALLPPVAQGQVS